LDIYTIFAPYLAIDIIFLLIQRYVTEVYKHINQITM